MKTYHSLMWISTRCYFLIKMLHFLDIIFHIPVSPAVGNTSKVSWSSPLSSGAIEKPKRCKNSDRTKNSRSSQRHMKHPQTRPCSEVCSLTAGLKLSQKLKSETIERTLPNLLCSKTLFYDTNHMISMTIWVKSLDLLCLLLYCFSESKNIWPSVQSFNDQCH